MWGTAGPGWPSRVGSLRCRTSGLIANAIAVWSQAQRWFLDLQPGWPREE